MPPESRISAPGLPSFGLESVRFGPWLITSHIKTSAFSLHRLLAYIGLGLGQCTYGSSHNCITKYGEQSISYSTREVMNH